MVCPNCQSTDIITVQGENFCISCGHVVPKSSKTKAAPTIEELTKVQAKVANSDEMAVLVGQRPETASPEPLAPKVRGLGPKLRAEDPAKAAGVTVQVTPGADQADAAKAQAELAQAVEKAMAPVQAPEPSAPGKAQDQPPSPKPAEPEPAKEATPAIVKHKSKPLVEPVPAETPKAGVSEANGLEKTTGAKPPLIKAAITKFAAPEKSGDEDAAVGEPKPAEAPNPPEAKAASAAPAAPAKRRKPGRPKAGRLDVAKPVAASPIQPVAAVITAPVPPAAPRLRPSGAGSRSVTDLRPVSASAPVATEPRPAPAAVPPSSPDSLTAPDATSDISQPLMVDDPATGLGGIVRMSLHERLRPASFGWSLLPATFLALLVGGVTLALVGGRFDAAVTATQQAGWAVWGEALLILGLYYLSHSLVGAAIIFGIARRVAHRPVPVGRQFSTAINSWLSRLMLDIAVLLLQLIVTGLVVGLMIAGSIVWPVPEWAHIAGLFVGFLALVYIMAGLTLAQGLGRVGLTVSLLSAGHALKLGWRLFWGHFELAGFRTLALLFELVLLVPFAAAAIAMVLLVPPAFSWAAVLGAVILTTIAGALAGAGTASWWEGAYRHLVEHDYQTESGRLLGGRPAERPRPFALAALIIAGTGLIGLSIAWPWLPLS